LGRLFYYLLVNGGNDFTWAFTGVCGSRTGIDKLRLWDEPQRATDDWSGPWCTGEDLNGILHCHERRVGAFPSNTKTEFQDFIIRGRDFTFSMSREEAVHSRLHHFLVPAE